MVALCLHLVGVDVAELGHFDHIPPVVPGLLLVPDQLEVLDLLLHLLQGSQPQHSRLEQLDAEAHVLHALSEGFG